MRIKSKIKRTPVLKKIKRTPFILSGRDPRDNKKLKKIKRTPALKKIKRTPLILLRKDPRDNIDDYKKELKKARKRALEIAKKISTEDGYIESLTETNLEKTVLYVYQKSFMRDRSKFRHCDKSRQVGMSYCFSCEAYAKTQLLDIYTALLISYNQEEANEKVLYARILDESTPHKYKKKLVVDRITALEWEGRSSSGRKTRTRLMSHPQREPRGKGFNTDVFLDEMAHYQWQEKIYIASVPIISRGIGQLAMASSPLGKGGLFYEIGNDNRTYNMYSRHRIFWWDNPDFLNEYAIKNFDKIPLLVQSMDTEERVNAFGNETLVQIFNSMLLDYFQQEYELVPIDETISYFPMDLIKQCTFEALLGEPVVEDGDDYGEHVARLNPIYPGLEFNTFRTIEDLSGAIARGKVTKNLIAGLDIGRNENNSEIIVLEEIPNLGYLQIIRLILSMKDFKFKDQFNVIEKLFSLVPVKKMKVDVTGMGKNLGEDLTRRFHSRIVPIDFNLSNKGDMASNLKLRMEDQSVAIPNNRDLIRQIHSIKRDITSNSNVRYDIANSEKRFHHGDKFWALALGSSAGEPAQMFKVRLFSSNISNKLGHTRIIKAPAQRIFRNLQIIHGTNYKKLPLPPLHEAEFLNIGSGVIFR